MDDSIEDINDLNLEFDPEFISTPPIYTAAEMIVLCEAMLPYWNSKKLESPPPCPEREPFILDDI